MNVAITTIHNFLRALTASAIKKPGLFLIGVAVVTAFAIFFISENFEIRTDTDEMIDRDLPFRQTYAEFNETFPQFANSFVIVIDAETPEEAEAVQLELGARLKAQTNLYTSVYAPGGGPFFEQNGFLYLNTETLSDLSVQLAAAEPVLAAVAEDQSLRGLFDVLALAVDDILEGDDPPEKLEAVLAPLTRSTEAAARGNRDVLSWQAIFLDDEDLVKAKRRLLLVQPVLDFTRLQSAKVSLQAARAAAAEMTAGHDRVTIRFTGKIALNSDELKSVSDGAALSGILSFFLVTLVLGFGIRSSRMVLAALTTLAVGLIWTGAFAFLAIGYLNIISIAFAVLFIGLGIDFAIHFSLRYQEEVRGGGPIDEALLKTAVGVGAPLALCAPTTALAFYAFIPTDYAGLAQLGLISGTGMFISFLTSMTVLPALLKLMPLKKGKVVFNVHAKEEAGFIEKNGRNNALAGLVAGALAIFTIPLVRFDFDPINLKDPKSESVETFFDLLSGDKTSPYVIQILADDASEAAEIKGVLSPLAEVDDVVTLASYIPGDQEDKLEIIDTTSIFLTPVFLNRTRALAPTVEENAAALAAYREKVTALETARPDLKVTTALAALARALEEYGKDERNAADKQALLQQNLFFHFPRLLDKLETALGAEAIVLADLPPGLTSRYRADDGRLRLEVFPAEPLSDGQSLEVFVTTVSGAVAEATGSPVQIYNAGKIVKGSMLQASGTAVIAIILFLFLILRRASSVALITIPVFLAGVLTMAAMAAFGLSFNFANVIVIPLLIGLGVDSGIHLVLRAREEQMSAKLLSTSTPKAVLLSALTTIGSFGTLAISAHLGTASMGLLLTIAIIMILIATLVVLPGLMIWIGNKQNTAKT